MAGSMINEENAPRQREMIKTPSSRNLNPNPRARDYQAEKLQALNSNMALVSEIAGLGPLEEPKVTEGKTRESLLEEAMKVRAERLVMAYKMIDLVKKRI
jgi:hypothetical protein